jgi:hypothetical protein
VSIAIKPAFSLTGLASEAYAEAISGAVLADTDTLMLPKTALAWVGVFNPVVEPFRIRQ